jgi:hypothetical protein
MVFLIILSGTVILSGVLLLARGLASSRRVTVDVRDDKGTTSKFRTSEVIARLGELGGMPPSGMLIARGSDVAALQDSALIGTPENKVLALLQTLFKNILGTIPWVLTVDAAGTAETGASKDKGSLSVIMTRNGRTHASATINRATLGLSDDQPDTPLDLYKAAAAFGLATLATAYKDIEGLAGATEWRSLGLQYVASTDFRDDDKGALGLLIRAVETDPGNHPASLMLQHRMFREGTTFDELSPYASWLKEQATDIRPLSADGSVKYGFQMHYRRLLANHLVAVQNLSYTDFPRDKEAAVKAHRQAAKKTAKDLVELIDNQRRRPSVMDSSMRHIAAVAYRTLTDPFPSTYPNEWDQRVQELLAQAEKSFSPWVRYNVACMYMALGDSESCLKHLVYARTDPRLQEWARWDPMLKMLHPEPRFQDLTGPRGYWEVAVLAPHKGKFADLGIANPLRLQDLDLPVSELAKYLDISELQCRILLQVAELAQLVNDYARRRPSQQGLMACQVDLAEALVSVGIVSPGALQGLDQQQQANLCREVHTALQKTCQSAPKADVDKWIEALSRLPAK